jgi:hypothetical protein
LVLCGNESALLAFVVIMISSHNITTSLCCHSVDRFIPIIAILKYDCKPALNTIIRKQSMVSTHKLWTNFWICS